MMTSHNKVTSDNSVTIVDFFFARMYNLPVAANSKPKVVPPFYARIGKLIRTARDSQSFTQGRLAKKAGLTRTSVTNIELGNQKILAESLWKIARGLNVPIQSLFPPFNQDAEPKVLIP